MCCRAFAVADYSCTLYALPLEPSDFCNVGVKEIKSTHIVLGDRLQELCALNKVSLSGQHHQIDCVKIFLTAIAPGQVSLRVYRSVIPVAREKKGQANNG